MFIALFVVSPLNTTVFAQAVAENLSESADEEAPAEEEIEEVAEEIELHGRQSLAPAIVKNLNQTDWVFYSEVRNNRHSHQDYYCLPLSEHSFLEVKFNHRVDRSDKYKKWKKDALAAQERIIASVYLDELPQEPSIEHNAD